MPAPRLGAARLAAKSDEDEAALPPPRSAPTPGTPSAANLDRRSLPADARPGLSMDVPAYRRRSIVSSCDSIYSFDSCLQTALSAPGNLQVACQHTSCCDVQTSERPVLHRMNLTGLLVWGLLCRVLLSRCSWPQACPSGCCAWSASPLSISARSESVASCSNRPDYCGLDR